MDDLINRQAAVDLFEERLNGWTLEEAIPIVDRFVNEREQCDDVWHAVVTIRDIAECVKQDVEKYLPSAGPEEVYCSMANRTCFANGKEVAWCLTCPHISEEDRELVRKAVEGSGQKTGKWIRHDEVRNVYGGTCVECSECGEKYVVRHIEDEKYCRNCGADMRGEKNE